MNDGEAGEGEEPKTDTAVKKSAVEGGVSTLFVVQECCMAWQDYGNGRDTMEEAFKFVEVIKKIRPKSILRIVKRTITEEVC